MEKAEMDLPLVRGFSTQHSLVEGKDLIEYRPPNPIMKEFGGHESGRVRVFRNDSIHGR
jgi:hypothetical protein